MKEPKYLNERPWDPKILAQHLESMRNDIVKGLAARGYRTQEVEEGLAEVRERGLREPPRDQGLPALKGWVAQSVRNWLTDRARQEQRRRETVIRTTLLPPTGTGKSPSKPAKLNETLAIVRGGRCREAVKRFGGPFAAHYERVVEGGGDDAVAILWRLIEPEDRDIATLSALEGLEPKKIRSQLRDGAAMIKAILRTEEVGP